MNPPPNTSARHLDVLHYSIRSCRDEADRRATVGDPEGAAAMRAYAAGYAAKRDAALAVIALGEP